MMLATFSHIGLNCDDPEITERFYERHFGFVRSRKINIDGRQIIFLRAGNIHLELFQADGKLPASDENDGPSNAGFRHIAFQVDDIYAQLNEMGADAEITLGPVDLNDQIKGWKVVWIKDPDGRIVEISHGYRDVD
jgi:glyoxylase I family protein